jgi:hypothetical protein
MREKGSRIDVGVDRVELDEGEKMEVDEIEDDFGKGERSKEYVMEKGETEEGEIIEEEIEMGEDGQKEI